MRIHLVIWCFVIVSSAHAQHMDSLVNLLQHSRNDSNKIQLLSRLSYEFRPTDPDMALSFAEEGLRLSDSLKYRSGEVMSLVNMVDVLIERAEFIKADSLIEIAIQISESINDLEGLAGCWYNKAIIYEETGKYEEAIIANLKTVKIYQKLNDEKMIGASYEGVGLVYQQINNMEMAAKYYQLSLQHFNQAKELRGVSSSHLNLAGYFEQTNQLDSAQWYYQKGFDIAKQLNAKRLMAWNLEGLAGIFMHTGRSELAEKNFSLALSFYQEIQDPISEAGLYINLGDINLSESNFLPALNLYQKSLQIAEKYQLQQMIEVSSFKISEVFASTGQFKEAYQFSKRSRIINDSLLQESTLQAISEMEAKYQSTQKQKQIEVQQLELARNKVHNRSLWGGLISAILMLIGSITIYMQRIKTKNLERKQLEADHREEKQLLLLATKEHAFKAFANGQEQERKRIAEDLHDGLGGTLSGIKLRLETLNLAPSNIDQHMASSIKTLNEACKELRNISHNLMPPNIEHHHLHEIIEQYLEEVSHLGGLQIHFDYVESENNHRVAPEIKINCYRILQEILHNVYKHSKASRVDLQILLFGDHLSLMVEDNGKGFEPSNSTNGIGMQNIHSRLEMLNGSLEIDSFPNRGTIITVSIPYG